MRIESSEKAKVLIVGVPRSGTTLVSNLLHSCANAFCLSEPHHEYQGNGTISLDKLSPIPGLPPYAETAALPVDDLVSGILNRTELGYSLGGFKETYRGMGYPAPIRNHHLIESYINAGYKVIGVLRDPARVWNSQKTCKESVFSDMEVFYQNWYGLLSLVQNPICYELLLINPAQEILNKTGIKISGQIDLKPTTFKIGDGFARISASIRDRKLAEIATPEERLKLEPLRHLYRSLLLPSISAFAP